MIQCKRAYEAASADDGCRVLVDGLWPRGLRKAALPLDGWLKELAPAPALRRAFGHVPERFEAFRNGYRKQLTARPELWWGLLNQARHGTLTLIYAARDEQHNNARVLAEFLEEELERHRPGSSPACYLHEMS